MVKEIEYQELVKKVIPANALQIFILELEDVYKRENGWDVGEITTNALTDRELEVAVLITKTKNNNQDNELKTTYISTINKNDYTKELTNLYEAYREDQGWVIGTPKITPINDNEILLRVPMTQHEVRLTK